MYNYGSNPTLTNCTFSGNSGFYGGGMCNYGSNPALTNCTFSGNSSDYSGGGMYNWNSKPTLTNCILWGNSDSGGVDESAQVHTEGVGGPFINYSCIQGWTGGLGGSGNMGANPWFADSSNDDYHLKSPAGRWDANSQSWVVDNVTSTCIDTGDPNSDWTAELWPHGKRINMGAYGGTPEASISQLDIGNIANLDNDVSDIVNSLDLALFVGKWCYEEFLLAEDLNRDSFVNFIDFAIFADNCELPPPGPLPGPASNPEPANGATEVDPNADLNWTAGVYAISHDVFFGTTINPPPFIHNQTATTFEPGTMAVGTTHYWRIDEVSAYGTTTGTVWRFTTLVPAHSATNPNPYNGQGGVNTTPVLSWTADPDATSHDVYFGTSNPPTFIRNQTATTFEPGTLEMATTYFWRIDEVGAYGTITGVVWSFLTKGGGPG
jgi:hypothetical protein